jgi:putative DNA primase/helicase
MGVTIRYNVIKKEEEILIPGESFTVDNRANASLAGLTSWCERFGMPSGKVGDYVTYLADKNLYNPVASWIMSKPWDGKTRIPDLMRTVTAKNEDDTETLDLKETLILRWMVSAVAAAFNPTGVSAHGILVFVGDQYLGKTKWFKSLAPADFISDGVTLDPKDKDSVKQAVSNCRS